MLTFDVLTVFPQLFTNNIKELPFKKAISNNLININLTNLRDFGLDSYGTIDQKPFGGGPGMLLMVEPIYNALIDIYKNYYTDENAFIEEVEAESGDKINKLSTTKTNKKDKIILLSPKGEKYNQKKATELKEYDHITFICGRYEGFDARIEKVAKIEKVSIGDFVLSGGELPALVIMESITRLLPGVLEKEEASLIESFSNGTLEYPQYTKPRTFKGFDVPEVLLSGNHKEIEKWRKENSKDIS